MKKTNKLFLKGRELDDGPGSIAAAALLLGEGGAGNEHLVPPPPMVYSIRSGENRIGSFILHKAEFCAGDIVLGNFDFSGASTRCLQVRKGGVAVQGGGAGSSSTRQFFAQEIPWWEISLVLGRQCGASR